MGLGGVAIAILPSIICLKLTFSDGLGGGNRQENPRITLPARDTVTQRQWFVHNTVQTIGATVSD